MELRKKFLKFALPSVASMWVFSLYTIVDGIFVARGVGEMAMAAVNLSMPFTSLIFMLGVLLATGTSTVIAIALGRGELKQARDYFNQNLMVSVIVGLLLTVVVLINLKQVALILGATESTLDFVKEYVGTIAVFAVFFMISYNLEVQVKANGAPHISTIGVFSCALINVGLDALFVMGFGWGVWGAALATGLAQVTSTVVFLMYFLTHRQRLRLGRFQLQLRAYRRILPLGLPEGLNELSNGLVVFLFNRTILRVMGETGLPAYTIISYVNTLVLMTMTGASQGMQPLVSFYLGAGERRNCHRLLKYGLVSVALFAVVFFSMSELGAPVIVSAFLEQGSIIFASSVNALRMYACAFLVVGFNVIFAGFFTAVERPGPAFAISISRSLVLMVISLFVMSALFGEKGIWYSACVSEVFCLILTVFCGVKYFRSQRAGQQNKEG